MQGLILKIDHPAYGGFFISRYEGKVVMIKGPTLPGETVEAVVDEEKRDYLKASVRKIIEPSPDRIEPACKYFGLCGGCSYQHITYKQQIELKEYILKDCLKRLANIETDIDESVINEDPWHYRLRAQFKVSPQGIGFHKSGTRDVVAMDRCLVMDDDLNEFIQKTSEFLKTLRIKEIHVTCGDSLIAQVIARKRALSLSDADRLASDLMGYGLSGLIIRRGDLEPLSYGNTYVTLDLLDLKYTVSPPSFIQGNWRLNQVVADIIRNTLRPLKGKRILDMYAGAGNFSLPLAVEAEVTAIEENPYAVEDGRRNIELNNIHNYRFVPSSAERFSTDERFDYVILDPPRPGLTNRAIKNVLTLMPERIVYISCNPATFARDLNKLMKKYNIDSVRMIDFFPQTFHIEALAFLHLK